MDCVPSPTPSKHVFLRTQGDIVGFGKYLFQAGHDAPSHSIHGVQLSRFAKGGEKLVAIHSVQIFSEFEGVRYPYRYGGVEEPPSTLEDLNVTGKSFKSIIAWDDRNLISHQSDLDLGSEPRVVSVSSIRYLRPHFVSRSPRKITFGGCSVQADRHPVGIPDPSHLGAYSNGNVPVSTPESQGSRQEDRHTVSDFVDFLEQSDGEEEACLQNNFDWDALQSVDLFQLDADEVEASNRVLQSNVSRQTDLQTSREASGEATSNSTPDVSVRQTPTRTIGRKRCRQLEQDVVSRDTDPDSSDSNDGLEAMRAVRARNVRRRRSHTSDIQPPSDNLRRGAPRREDADSTHGNDNHELGRTTINRVDDSSADSIDFVLQRLNLNPQRRQYNFNTRTKAAPKTFSRLRKRKLELSRRRDNPFLQSRNCCRARCFDVINPHYAFAQYKIFMVMERADKKQTLHELLDKRHGKFRFDGDLVCARFLWEGFSFSFCLQSCVKNTELARASSSILVASRSLRTDRKRDKIKSFLENLAESSGEKLPMKSQINLPSMKKIKVYEKFLDELRSERATNVPSRNYFYKVWKETCSHIKTHRYHGFTVCGTCEYLRAKMHEHATNILMQQIFRESTSVHHSQMAEERRCYQNRRDLAIKFPAIKFPEKYCSIIVDGADQKSYGLPHFIFDTKDDRGHKLAIRCIGVLEHLKKNLSLYTMTEEFESGANHVLEAVHRVLDDKKRSNGRLPEVLFVQADNCTRENKNRYFMAYFEMLVARAVFIEVQVSFLPIGHTHSDIDQSFSSVASRLRSVDAVTMEELLNELRMCYSPRASAEDMTRVANFSGLCENSGCLSEVKDFSQYRYFRFTRKSEGRSQNLFGTCCDVRVQISDEWTSLKLRNDSEQETTFLETIPNLRNVPPTTTKVPPDVQEINKCFRSCDRRIGSDAKMRSLEAIRDRVYSRRQDLCHWDTTSTFEMNGGYHDAGNHPVSTGPIAAAVVSEASTLRYNLNYFVAVQTSSEEEDPFWIAKTLSVSENDTGEVMLRVHWYIPSQGSSTPFKSAYQGATVLRENRHVLHVEDLSAESVLCEFERLTSKKRLNIRTQKAIRQALDAA